MKSFTHPFTKQALIDIFNKNTPVFSYAANRKTCIQSNPSDDTIIIQDHKLSFKRYIEQQFYTRFNNHYDQFENMSLNINHPKDNQYVWSQKQHILIANVIVETNNIEFIKCINTDDETQFQFLTLTYDRLFNNYIIHKIAFSFQLNQHYLNNGKYIHDGPVYANQPFSYILDSVNNTLVQSEIINNIILENGDDQQHDLSHYGTKIGNYKCSISNQYELWHIYCDTIYVNNNKVMEMYIKRWNMSDYSSIWHSIQYCNESTTTSTHSPNLSSIQSYVCLIPNGIFNLIVKVNLNSQIVDHNLYMYPIPEYFNPVFDFKKEKNIGIKLKINNSILSDIVVLENTKSDGFHILTFQYDDGKFSIIIHRIANINNNNYDQTSISNNLIECKDTSLKQFNFEYCRFKAFNLQNQHIIFWATDGNSEVRNAIFIIDTVNNQWHMLCDLREAEIEGLIHIEKVYAKQCPKNGHIKFGIICLMQIDKLSCVVTLIGMMYQHHQKHTLYFTRYTQPNNKQYQPLFSIIQSNHILSTLEMYCEPI